MYLTPSLTAGTALHLSSRGNLCDDDYNSDPSIEFGMDVCFSVSFENSIRDTSNNQCGGHFGRHLQSGGRKLAIYWGIVYFPNVLVDFDL